MANLWRSIIHIFFLNSLRYVLSSHGNRDKEIVMGSSGKCDEKVKDKTAFCSGRHLRAVPDDLNLDLEILDLSRNAIHSLMNASFIRYPRLVELHLKDNNISIIEIGAFSPLKQLKLLDISENWNMRLSSGNIFKWSGELIHLDLHTSNLRTIPNDILRWLPKLELLNLHTNKIYSIDITNCGTGPNLTVDLSNNDFTSITAETFVFSCQCDFMNLEFSHVQKIDADVISSLFVRRLSITIVDRYPNEMLLQLFDGISKSEIRELQISDIRIPVDRFPPRIFESMYNKSLSFLYFGFLSLNFLQPLIFTNLSHVAHLDIGTRDLHTFEPDVFRGMSELRILNFHSQLKNINEKRCRWDLDLHLLNLSTNHFRALDWNTFLGLENLTVLDLRGNIKLAFLNITESSGLRSLNTLNVRGTSLHSISIYIPLLKTFMLSTYYIVSHGDDLANLFGHSQLLETIDMRSAGIVSLWYPKYNHSLFRGLRNLAKLWLSRNDLLTKIQNGTFLDQFALAELDVRSCQLSTIEPGAFIGLNSLQTLSLERNRLHNLPRNVFHGMKQLTNLHLDHNELTSFDNDIFIDTAIVFLTLSDNQLVKLSPATFHLVEPVLKVIDISWNPLECNCEMKWLLQWFRRSVKVMNTRSSVKVMNTNFTRCSSASMKSLIEKPIMSLKLTDQCSPNLPLYFSISLAFVVIMVVTIVVYINWWVLKYNLFRLRLTLFGYHVLADPRGRTDYRYDLNVMFSDDDREWACGNLRPNLEEKLPHFARNAYGDEDLTHGMFYLDAVLHLVENSFKTILVLSNAALLNHWFMIKFRLALDHVNDTQTDNVLLIFIEEIPTETQPYILRLYINDGKQHLIWTADEQNQENFWTELLGSLKVNLRRTHLIPRK